MADKKISELDPANTLDGTEEVPVVQTILGTPTTVRTTVKAIGGTVITGRLATGLDLYVNGSTGSDSNDGLTPATAFATIQYAADYVTSKVTVANSSDYYVTVHIAAGTYAENVFLGSITGGGHARIQGVVGDSSQVIVSPASASPFYCQGAGLWSIEWLQVSSGNSFGKFGLIDNGGGTGCTVSIAAVNFGTNTGAAHVTSSYNGEGNCGITTIQDCKIVGNALALASAASGGYIELSHGTCDVNSLNPWSSAVFIAGQHGRIYCRTGSDYSFTNSGSVTVPKVRSDSASRCQFDSLSGVPGITPVISGAGWVADGATDTIVGPSFVGDTGTGGTIGYVPAPASGDAAALKFLKADGTWATTPGGGGITVGTTTVGSGTSLRVLYDNAGVVGEYTNTQLTALINAFSSTLSGAAPASGGGTSNFLRADGNWAAPTGGITVGTTAIASGTATHVVYEDSGNKFGEAANFVISSGNPKVTSSGKYLFDTGTAIFSQVANINWCFGDSGNTSLTGFNNTGVGGLSLAALTGGSSNVAIGRNALNAITSHSACTAIGMQALQACDIASNVAVGYQAGIAITTATPHVLIGNLAGNALTTTETDNTFVGFQAGAGSTGTSNSVAIGSGAYVNATGGTGNVAIGVALAGGNSGSGNMAIGYLALAGNTSGGENVAVGSQAGSGITTSPNNVCIGSNCAKDITTSAGSNTIIGRNTGRGITTGDSNTIIGANLTGLGTTLTNNVILCNGGGNIVFKHDATDIFIANSANFAVRLLTTITGGGTGNAPTLTTGPANGDPTKWIPIDDNGTTRYIPAW